MSRKKIKMAGSREALAVFGEYDKNLKKLEKKNNVKIYARGNSATVEGSKENVEKTVSELEKLRFSAEDSDMEKVISTATGKKIKPLGSKQKEYLKAMQERDLVVAIGPAGTGKTFLACVNAVKSLRTGEVDRIVLTRPVVETGEKLGFLPGDLQEKIDPYLRPLYDAFYTIMGPSKFHKYASDGIIEIVPLAYMRGRTLDDAMIVLDEAQNTSSGQMEMFLTRIGFNSRAVVTGDVTQIDLEKNRVSGLVEIQQILRNLSDIEFVYFSQKDVVRHQLVKRIIDAYKKFKETKNS